MNKEILKCNNLIKSYHDGKSEIEILKGINFNLKSGESVAIIGPSGCGKSTFLHLLGGLDRPNKGEVLINNKNWFDLSENRRCKLRSSFLGFVYQFHHLLPEFSALENVAMPLLLTGRSPRVAKEEAKKILTHVNLQDRLEHLPSELSGGERQRVAIARALVNNPQCILADEPTGNLDPKTANQVLDLLLHLNKEYHIALVIVTHDYQLAKKMNKIFIIQNGLLTDG